MAVVAVAAKLSVRTEFPDIAFWRASVQTDANGKASVQVTLPDNLTTWVMDARAVTEDTRVGQSTTEVVATKDLLVRPVLPRFFTEGDKAEIAARHPQHDQPCPGRDLQRGRAGACSSRERRTARTTIPAGGTYKAVWPVETVAECARGRS